QVQDSLLAVDPSLKYGISPFGIWKNGVPSGTSGLDAFSVIYADATAWLDAETIDYIAPQLYWSSQRAIDTNGDGTPDRFNQQRFTTLAPWWESVRNTRHLYPGLGAYRIGEDGYDANEVPAQIRYTRTRGGIEGTILFRVYDGILSRGLGLADSLSSDLNRRAALTPPMAWKSQEAPGTPGTLSHTWEGEELTLTWSPPSDGDGAETRRYAVYRIPSPEAPTFPDALAEAEHLIEVTGATTFTDRPAMAASPWTYVVTAVSANSIESDPTNAVVVDGRAVQTESAPGIAASLLPPRPNPSSGQTEIAFSLTTPSRVTVRVLDVLGREVARLVDGDVRATGLHAVEWDGRSTSGGRVASGMYLVVLEENGTRRTRPLTLIR
ncbi:MAG: family 10 glycosylhydrolase, partial [Bacteroidota bacterium]